MSAIAAILASPNHRVIKGGITATTATETTQLLTTLEAQKTKPEKCKLFKALTVLPSAGIDICPFDGSSCRSTHSPTVKTKLAAKPAKGPKADCTIGVCYRPKQTGVSVTDGVTRCAA